MFDLKLIKLRSEDEIISKWKTNSAIKVSIVCATYNQEAYIEDALKGFLMQETSFAFEIVIHDDASTDSTPSIIRKFQEIYPKIIRPVFQNENQYSKGSFKPSIYAASYAKGNYIALCEGDDYWVEPTKIQRQYDELEIHPNLNLCFTRGSGLDRFGGYTEICNHSLNDQVIAFEDIIIGGGSFMPTCSLFFRKSAIDDLPDWFFNVSVVGDQFIQMLTSLPNGALYLSTSSVVYRFNAVGSYTSNQKKLPYKERLKRLNRHIYCIDQVDDFTSAEYRDSFKKVRASAYLNFAIDSLKQKRYSEIKNMMMLSWNEFDNLNYLQVVLRWGTFLAPLIRIYFKLRVGNRE